MRKVFLDDLPRKEGWGVNKGKFLIDWESSVGYTVDFIYDDVVGRFEITNYIFESNTIEIKYNEKLEKTYVANFRNSNIKYVLFGKRSKDFKVELGTQFKDDKRNMLVIDREHREKEQKPNKVGKVYFKSEKWYKYKCNVCGYKGWIVESSLLNQKGGCSCCSNRTVVLGINTIWDTDRWMCDLGVSEDDAKKYTKCSNQNILVKCPICGNEKYIKISDLYVEKSIGCSMCSDGVSYPEKLMTSVLTQLSVDFETQYSPDYLENKRSDFYLRDYKLIVETDGALGHEGGTTHSKSDRTLKELVKIDKWKDEQHLKHGIKTIRIDCFKSDLEYVKNSILNSDLANIFDLSKVDWKRCEEFALKNITRSVWDYWNNKNKNETISDLSTIFNLTDKTIRKYLSKGWDLGKCIYNPREECDKAIKNGLEKARKKRSKMVSIIKDGQVIDTFKSCHELDRCSQEKFGVWLDYKRISAVCRGEIKQYKGFTFKYVQDN